MQLTILGCNAAYPANGRFTSAQVLNVNEALFLIDAGEGVQIQLADLKIRRSKINHIFISHLHGDHILGLPGLLGSFGLQGRTTPLHIYSPKGLQAFVETYLRISYVSETAFPIIFHEIPTHESALIFENKNVTVHTIPLKHDVPTAGFLFREKSLPRKMLKAKIKAYNIPYTFINGIKGGNDFIMPDGQTIPNQELTLPPPSARSYAYCSDTAYDETLIDYIKNVNLLYHETTFEAALAEKLLLRPVHSTTHQAATIALKANVKQLIIGHFSPRYKHLEPLLLEAQSIFPNTALGVDGAVFNVAQASCL